MKSLVLQILLVLLPLFFLPLTQEFYITNKFYLLIFACLLLLFISILEFLVSKKIVWRQNSLDSLILLFILTIGASTVVSSPNKIQALLNPNFGLVALTSLAILYFYLSRTKTSLLSSKIFRLSSIILSLVTIIFFFQPFKNFNLPQNWLFLKNPAFTPMGSQLDLVIFLGFFVVCGLSRVIASERSERGNPNDTKRATLNSVFLILNLLALSLTLYSLLKPPASSLQLPASITLPPFNISWYAAVETLKNPVSALFGVGIDNFASMYTRVKDFAYNQSSLWQISSFTISRSTILHIFTESGLFGLLAFGLLIFSIIKQQFNKLAIKQSTLPLLLTTFYLLLIMIFFPPSLIVFFLFFVTLAVTGQAPSHSSEINLSNFLSIYLITVIVALFLVGATTYLLGRSYVAEYYFKKSLDGYLKNSAKEVYNNQRQAVLLNPYMEKYRLNFAQTNLLIANNIATAVGRNLKDQDRNTITQAIQAAINEAKAAVSLNPQKASNWENLAVIYRNIINVAQGADTWTISAYQRAIIADPQNPIYRLNLGGVYYSLGNYDEASNLFAQAASLKPDWSNAHYNLAWASFQKKDYQKAAAEMQNALSLLDPKRDEADYKKAATELDDFKKKLPETEEATTKSGQLKLPQAPETNVEPKIQLPKTASPEAK